MFGVFVREMGEWDRSEAPEEALCEDLRCVLFPKGGVPASDLDAGGPFVSKGGYSATPSGPKKITREIVRLPFSSGHVLTT